MSALKKETEETVPKFEEEKADYPKNYLKGKFMPWRSHLQKLGDDDDKEVMEGQDQKMKKSMGQKFSILSRKGFKF